MNTSLVLASQAIIQAQSADASGINFSGFQQVLIAVAGLVVMWAGTKISNRGGDGNFKKAADSGAAVLVGAIVVGIGLSFMVVAAFGPQLVRFISSAV